MRRATIAPCASHTHRAWARPREGDKVLPLRLTVGEFAFLVRQGEETIRREIRARLIAAQGRPYLIPRRELEKFGVTIAEAEAYYDSFYPLAPTESMPVHSAASPGHCTSSKANSDRDGTKLWRFSQGS